MGVSKVNKLKDLIHELCPNGVEYQKLADCCVLEKGNTPIQKAIPGEFPLVVTTEERKSCNTYQFDKPTVCIPLVSSRGHGVASLNSLYYQEGKFALGNILCGVTPVNSDELSAKFLFYYLNHKKDTLIVPLMRGGANVSLTVDSLKRVIVPVPPIPVQNEIVRIFDKFESLVNELVAELTARKKQYAYYRTQLLTHQKNGSKMMAIADLGKWSGGKTPLTTNEEFWENGTIPWISSKDMKASVLDDTEDHLTEKALADGGMTLLPEGVVAIVTRSGILKHTLPVAYVPFKTTVNQDIKALVVKDGISSRYVFHALQTFAEDIRKTAKKQGGTVDSLEFQKVLAYEIPVPTPDMQERLVDVLDSFESICSNLNIGLPAEIQAREKQYEYYRDKLLTFKSLP